MEQKKILYCYCRVSTEEQQQRDLSLPSQIALGKSKAEELGMDFQLFIEAGESASHDGFENRPELQKLLALVKQGTAKHVFTFDQTRLSRNDLTKAIISHALNKAGVILYTHSKAFDFNRAEDLLTYRFLEAMEGYESFLRKSRFKLGYVSAHRKGRYTGPMPPYGYKKDKEGYLIIDEEEKVVYLQMIDLYLNKGYGTNKIAEWLNTNGIPTKSSKILKQGYLLKEGIQNRKRSNHKQNNRWNPGSINSIFKNEVYTGKRRFKTGKDTYEYTTCEPLIDKETFDKLQLVRSNNAITGKKEDKYFYLLKDRLQCGNCLNALHGRVKPNRGERSYRCNSKREAGSTCAGRGINIDKLNIIVWKAYLASYHYHRQINVLIQSQLQDQNGLQLKIEELHSYLNSINNQEKKVNQQMKELLKKSIDGRLSEDVYNEVMNDLTTELKLLSDNKLACTSNIKIISQQLKDRQNATSELTQGLNAYTNAKAIADKLIPPFMTEDSQTQARAVIKEAIKNILVSYSEAERQYTIEVEFNKVGIRNAFRDKEPHSFKEIDRKSVTISAKEALEPLVVEPPSKIRLLNDSPEFREVARQLEFEDSKKNSRGRAQKKVA